MGPTTIARGITRGRVTEPGRRYPSRRGTTLTALGPVSGKRQRPIFLDTLPFGRTARLQIPIPVGTARPFAPKGFIITTSADQSCIT